MKNVKAEYKTFDICDKNCVNYAKKLIQKCKMVNLDIAYIVGAFHDYGIKFENEKNCKSYISGIFDEVTKRKYHPIPPKKIIIKSGEKNENRN